MRAALPPACPSGAGRCTRSRRTRERSRGALERLAQCATRPLLPALPAEASVRSAEGLARSCRASGRAPRRVRVCEPIFTSVLRCGHDGAPAASGVNRAAKELESVIAEANAKSSTLKRSPHGSISARSCRPHRPRSTCCVVQDSQRRPWRHVDVAKAEQRLRALSVRTCGDSATARRRRSLAVRARVEVARCRSGSQQPGDRHSALPLPQTVERHVSNILLSQRAKSRTELAALATGSRAASADRATTAEALPGATRAPQAFCLATDSLPRGSRDPRWRSEIDFLPSAYSGESSSRDAARG